jgi:anti-sigma B factor antagonist
MTVPLKPQPLRSAFVSDAPFACLVEHRGHEVTVALSGEVDLASAPELRRRLLALLVLPVERLTIDMNRVTFMDSSGLHALTDAQHAADANRIRLTLARLSPVVRRLLEVVGMDELFEIPEAT